MEEDASEEEEVAWSEIDPDVDRFLQYGYAPPEIIQALEASSSDLTNAHKLLYFQLTGADHYIDHKTSR